MVLGHDGIGKGGRSWIEPPWAEDGPERVAIDADLPADGRGTDGGFAIGLGRFHDRRERFPS